MYWNDKDLLIESYERKKKRYFCGNKLVKVERKKRLKFVVVIVDLTETYCAKVYDDGELEKVFEIFSNVQNKHKKGGQSAQRFARAREQSIIRYFKKINEKLKDVKQDFVIGVNFIYKNRLEGYLSTENKNKLIKFISTEYGGLSGCYQAKNCLNEE